MVRLRSAIQGVDSAENTPPKRTLQSSSREKVVVVSRSSARSMSRGVHLRLAVLQQVTSNH